MERTVFMFYPEERLLTVREILSIAQDIVANGEGEIDHDLAPVEAAIKLINDHGNIQLADGS